MRVDVILLPAQLQPRQLRNRAVVVFDVLRATTSMTAALAAGVAEIRIFSSSAAARAAHELFSGPCLLCGEENSLPPPGFDLGNSPRAFTPELHRGRTVFLSTTNGTGALLAAAGAAIVFVGALTNAAAVARAVLVTGLDVLLLCSGTNGTVSMEDLLGCGAVLDALGDEQSVIEESDNARIARRLFAASRNDLPRALRQTRAGHNVLSVGLEPDIDFAAALNRSEVVGRAFGDPPVVRQIETA